MDAAVASDGSGAIVVQSGRRVESSRSTPEAGSGSPSVVSRGRTADFAASAVGRGGAAVVVWFRHTRARRWRLEAAVRDSGAAAFGAPQPLSRFVRRACCTHVTVAIGDRGDAVAAWRSTLDPALWTSLRRAGESFRPAQRLGEDSSDVPKVAVGGDGTAAVLYSLQRVPVRAGDGLRLQRAEPGGAFGAPEVVNPGRGVTIGETAITPAGRVLVAWVDHPEAVVRVSESEPGAPLVEAGAIGAGVAPRAGRRCGRRRARGRRVVAASWEWAVVFRAGDGRDTADPCGGVGPAGGLGIAVEDRRAASGAARPRRRGARGVGGVRFPPA